MKVDVTFESKAQINDKVYYDNPDSFTFSEAEVVNMRFDYGHSKFKYLIELPNGTRDWVYEDKIAPIFRQEAN